MTPAIDDIRFAAYELARRDLASGTSPDQLLAVAVTESHRRRVLEHARLWVLESRRPGRTRDVHEDHGRDPALERPLRTRAGVAAVEGLARPGPDGAGDDRGLSGSPGSPAPATQSRDPLPGDRGAVVAEAEFDPNEHPRGEAGRWATKGHGQTTSSEFKDWFGDWEAEPAQASKVVDRDGKPLRLFHGTSADFKEFGSPRDTLSAIGWHYFSDNPAFAEKFAGSDQPLDYETGPAVSPVEPPTPDLQVEIQVRNPDGEFESRPVNAWTTKADGLVLTSSGDADNKFVTLTHQPSGLALASALTPKQAQWMAGELSKLGIDWTQDKDGLMASVRGETMQKMKDLSGEAAQKTRRELKRAAASRAGQIDPVTLQWKTDAIGEGSRVLPVYLNLRNPLDLTSLKARKPSLKQFIGLLNELGIDVTPRDFPFSGRDLYQMLNDADVAEKLRRKALAAGYDGIVFKDFYDPKTKGTSYIAFHGEQVKSASGNRGSFDPTKTNINESASLQLSEAQDA